MQRIPSVVAVETTVGQSNNTAKSGHLNTKWGLRYMRGDDKAFSFGCPATATHVFFRTAVLSLLLVVAPRLAAVIHAAEHAPATIRTQWSPPTGPPTWRTCLPYGRCLTTPFLSSTRTASTACSPWDCRRAAWAERSPANSCAWWPTRALTWWGRSCCTRSTWRTRGLPSS